MRYAVPLLLALLALPAQAQGLLQNVGTSSGVTQGVEPTPTCFDGIQNGDETGVDCGGSCSACADRTTYAVLDSFVVDADVIAPDLSSNYQELDYGRDTLNTLFGPGLMSPAGQVMYRDSYGTSDRYFSPVSPDSMAVRTTVNAAGWVVEGFSRKGTVVARVSEDPATGLYRGVKFRHDGNAGSVVGASFFSGWNGVGEPTGGSVLSVDLDTVLTGYDRSATAGHQLRYGVVGTEVFIEYDVGDGVWQEVGRSEYDAWRLPAHGWAGALGGWDGQEVLGWRNITFRSYSETEVQETLNTGTLLASDFGVYGFETTGSIAQGSDQLTVADASGFAVGDGVIIPVDTTQASGRRGSTDGPGGFWPGDSVATVADLAPNDGAAQVLVMDESYKGVQGVVYATFSGDPNWYSQGVESPLGSYNKSVAFPKALVTTVVSKSGNTLTLADTAHHAVTGRDVFRDNAQTYFFEKIATIANVPTNPATNIVLPAGPAANDYRISGAGQVQFGAEWASRELDTAGPYRTILHTPLGAGTFNFRFVNTDNMVVRNVAIQGEHFDHGYSGGSAAGIRADASGMRLYDVRVRDVRGSAINSGYTANTWGFRVSHVKKDGNLQYSNWGACQWSDGWHGGCVDSWFQARRQDDAFESFDSDSVQYLRPSTVNGNNAVNSGQRTVYKDLYVHFTTNAAIDFGTPGEEYDEYWMTAGRKAGLDINDNVNRLTAAGGAPTLIIRPVITFEGRVGDVRFGDGSTKQSLQKGIVQGGGVNPHVDIRITDGMYWVPDSIRTGDFANEGAIGFDNAADALVSGFISYGDQGGHGYQFPPSDIFVNTDASATVENSVAEAIVANGTLVEVNNETYSGWEAALPANQAPTAGFYVRPLKGGGFQVFPWKYATDADWDDETAEPTFLSTDPDGHIIKYRWDFGDGTTSKSRVWSHDYITSGAGAGTYPVTLTVYDDRHTYEPTGVSDTVTCSVTVDSAGVTTAQTCQ